MTLPPHCTVLLCRFIVPSSLVHPSVFTETTPLVDGMLLLWKMFAKRSAHLSDKIITESYYTAYYMTQPDSLLSKGHLVMFWSVSLQGQPGICVRLFKPENGHLQGCLWSFSSKRREYQSVRRERNGGEQGKSGESMGGHINGSEKCLRMLVWAERKESECSHFISWYSFKLNPIE